MLVFGILYAIIGITIGVVFWITTVIPIKKVDVNLFYGTAVVVIASSFAWPILAVGVLILYVITKIKKES